MLSAERNADTSPSPPPLQPRLETGFPFSPEAVQTDDQKEVDGL
jgi:hypothetical protein